MSLLTSTAAILDTLAFGASKKLDTIHIIFRQEAIGTKVTFLFILLGLEAIDEFVPTEAINAPPLAFVTVAVSALGTKSRFAKVTEFGLSAIRATVRE